SALRHHAVREFESIPFDLVNVAVFDRQTPVPGGRLAVRRAEQDENLPQVFFRRASGLRSVSRVGGARLLGLQPRQAGGEHGDQQDEGDTWRADHRANYSITAWFVIIRRLFAEPAPAPFCPWTC